MGCCQWQYGFNGDHYDNHEDLDDKCCHCIIISETMKSIWVRPALVENLLYANLTAYNYNIYCTRCSRIQIKINAIIARDEAECDYSHSWLLHEARPISIMLWSQHIFSFRIRLVIIVSLSITYSLSPPNWFEAKFSSKSNVGKIFWSEKFNNNRFVSMQRLNRIAIF